MEIELETEKKKLTGEIQQLGQQLQQVDQQRQLIINEMVKRQGAIEMLGRLDGHKDKAEVPNAAN